MADKSKNKAAKIKNLKAKLKKFKLPVGKKSIIAALMAPGMYQAFKNIDLNMSDLKLLDITDEDVREVYSNKAKKIGKNYSGLKGKGQLASDVLGTAFDFSPYGLLTDSDLGFGSKTLGAGTLNKKTRGKEIDPKNLTPSQLKQLKNTMYGEENFKNLERKLSVPRKKGGKIIKAKIKKNKKVGRPKGVGCATKGYGKAMNRGK